VIDGLRDAEDGGRTGGLEGLAVGRPLDQPYEFTLSDQTPQPRRSGTFWTGWIRGSGHGSTGESWPPWSVRRGPGRNQQGLDHGRAVRRFLRQQIVAGGKPCPAPVSPHGIAIVAREDADEILAAMRAHPLGADAAIIGECVPDHPGMVVTKTTFGATRVVDTPIGEQLPRIC
jgi:hypothetical protein